ncbi:MAG: hypothetical protein D6766_14780 [Verrucomicrobia bacterium]|nr:MAG: hypothetical protein D6766_14780 [Verrucomicrobiota bacterium]
MRGQTITSVETSAVSVLVRRFRTFAFRTVPTRAARGAVAVTTRRGALSTPGFRGRAALGTARALRALPALAASREGRAILRPGPLGLGTGSLRTTRTDGRSLGSLGTQRAEAEGADARLAGTLRPGSTAALPGATPALEGLRTAGATQRLLPSAAALGQTLPETGVVLRPLAEPGFGALGPARGLLRTLGSLGLWLAGLRASRGLLHPRRRTAPTRSANAVVVTTGPRPRRSRLGGEGEADPEAEEGDDDLGFHGTDCVFGLF